MKFRWVWLWLVIPPILFAALALMGCADKSPQWRLYARGSYLFGRVEAKAEALCGPPPAAALTSRQAFCQEAASTDKAIKALAPMVEEQLAKPEVDWAVVLRWVELILQFAGPFIPVP